MKKKSNRLDTAVTLDLEAALRIALELEPAANPWDRSDAALSVNADLARCAHPIVLQLSSSARDICIRESLQNWWTHWRRFQLALAICDRPGMPYGWQAYRYMTLADALNRFKGRWRELELKMDVIDEREPASPFPEPDSDEVQTLLKTMPPVLRNLLTGHFINNKTYLQLAAESGISQATAWRKVQHARQLFRQLLDARSAPEGNREAS